MGLEQYMPGDPTPQVQAPVKVPPKQGLEAYTGDLDKIAANSGSVDFGRLTNTNLDEYSGYLTHGVNSDFNIDLQRANAQGFWESLGIKAANLPFNILFDFGDAIGSLGTLIGQTGDDRSYSNGLTDLMQKWKDPFGTVYEKNPGTAGISDSAWWLNNIFGLGEYAVQFGLLGAGEAKLFSSLATGAADALQLGSTGTKIAQGAAQVLTSAHLNYVMAASSGYKVYQQAYNTNLQKFLNTGADYDTAVDKAKHIASQSAATTVQMITGLNTLFSMSELAPMFRTPEDSVVSWFKKDGVRAEGETVAEWKQRLADTSMDSLALKTLFKNRSGATSIPSTAFQSGIQMANMKVGEDVGDAEGKSGKPLGFVEQFGQLSNYFDSVLSDQGMLNFAIGAVAGLVHPLILDKMPVNRIVKFDGNGDPIYRTDTNGKMIYEKDGTTPKYQTELVSTRTRNEVGARTFFDNIRKSIVKDGEWYAEKHAELAAAVARNDDAAAEKIRTELFSVGHINSVVQGFADNWKKTYQEIATTDNTTTLASKLDPQIQQLQEQGAQEQDPTAKDQIASQITDLQKQQLQLGDATDAMQKGYAKDAKDNEYKTRALDAVDSLGYLQKLHDDIQRKYIHTNPDPDAMELGDHLFFRAADLYLQKKSIDREEMKITDEEQRIAGLSTVSDPGAFDASVQKYNDHIQNWKVVNQSLTDDINDLNSKDPDKIKKVLSRYRAKGYNEGDFPTAIQDTVSKLKAKQRLYDTSIEQAEKTLHEGTGFQAWKEANPEGTFDDYRKEVVDKNTGDMVTRIRRANLEKIRVEHNIAEDNFREMRTEKNRSEFMKKAHNDKADWAKRLNDKNAADTTQAYKDQRDQEVAAQLNTIHQNRLLTQVQKEWAGKKLDAMSLTKDIARMSKELQEKMQGTSTLRKFSPGILALKAKIEIATRRRAKLLEHITGLEAQEKDLKGTTQAAQVNEQNVADTNRDVTGIPPQSGPSAASMTPVTEPAPSPVIPPETESSIDDLLNAQAPPDYVTMVQALPARAQLLVEHIDKTMQGEGFSYDKALSMIQPLITRQVISEDTGRQIIVEMKKAMDLTRQSAVQLEDPAVEPQEEVTRTDVISSILSRKVAELDKLASRTDLSDDDRSNIEAGILAKYDRELANLNNVAPDDQEDRTIVMGEEPDSPFINYMLSMDDATPLIRMESNHENLAAISALKVNYRTIKYNEGIDKNGNYIIVADYKNLDDNVNKDILKPGVINMGDQIVLKVDTKWKGSVTSTDRMQMDDYGDVVHKDDNFSKYSDSNGKVKMDAADGDENPGYANVPIQIVHKKTGKVLGYLPRLDWVMAQYEGASNHRNIVDTLYDKEGNPIDNLEIQKQRLMAVRKAIANGFNALKDDTSSFISRRKPGRIFYNTDVNKNSEEGKDSVTSKLKPGLAKNLLPDSSLNYGIIQKGTLNVGSNQPFTGATNFSDTDTQAFDNMPVVLLPMPNNKHSFSPLYTRKLSTRPGDVNTVIRAIELHLVNGTKDMTPEMKKQVDTIREKTASSDRPGYDVTTTKGLRDFINQYYTYTQKFSDIETRADIDTPEGTPKVSRFLLNIADPLPGQGTANIKIGTSFSGVDPKYASIIDGKLDPAFEAALEKGLATHYKNVVFTKDNVKGLNSTGDFNMVTIRKDGQIFQTKFDSYNDYMKSFAETYVYGLHKDGSTYLYGANPIMELDYGTMLGASREAPVAPRTSDSTLADIFNASLNHEFEEGTAHELSEPVQGKEITEANLQELHNFTPIDRRNTRTVAEVSEELSRMGITKLAGDHNPFLKC